MKKTKTTKTTTTTTQSVGQKRKFEAFLKGGSKLDDNQWKMHPIRVKDAMGKESDYIVHVFPFMINWFSERIHLFSNAKTDTFEFLNAKADTKKENQIRDEIKISDETKSDTQKCCNSGLNVPVLSVPGGWSIFHFIVDYCHSNGKAIWLSDLAHAAMNRTKDTKDAKDTKDTKDKRDAKDKKDAKDTKEEELIDLFTDESVASKTQKSMRTLTLLLIVTSQLGFTELRLLIIRILVFFCASKIHLTLPLLCAYKSLVGTVKIADVFDRYVTPKDCQGLGSDMDLFSFFSLMTATQYMYDKSVSYSDLVSIISTNMEIDNETKFNLASHLLHASNLVYIFWDLCINLPTRFTFDTFGDIKTDTEDSDVEAMDEYTKSGQKSMDNLLLIYKHQNSRLGSNESNESNASNTSNTISKTSFYDSCLLGYSPYDQSRMKMKLSTQQIKCPKSVSINHSVGSQCKLWLESFWSSMTQHKISVVHNISNHMMDIERLANLACFTINLALDLKITITESIQARFCQWLQLFSDNMHSELLYTLIHHFSNDETEYPILFLAKKCDKNELQTGGVSGKDSKQIEMVKEEKDGKDGKDGKEKEEKHSKSTNSKPTKPTKPSPIIWSESHDKSWPDFYGNLGSSAEPSLEESLCNKDDTEADNKDDKDDKGNTESHKQESTKNTQCGPKEPPRLNFSFGACLPWYVEILWRCYEILFRKTLSNPPNASTLAKYPSKHTLTHTLTHTSMHTPTQLIFQIALWSHWLKCGSTQKQTSKKQTPKQKFAMDINYHPYLIIMTTKLLDSSKKHLWRSYQNQKITACFLSTEKDVLYPEAYSHLCYGRECQQFKFDSGNYSILCNELISTLYETNQSRYLVNTIERINWNAVLSHDESWYLLMICIRDLCHNNSKHQQRIRNLLVSTHHRFRASTRSIVTDESIRKELQLSDMEWLNFLKRASFNLVDENTYLRQKEKVDTISSLQLASMGKESTSISISVKNYLARQIYELKQKQEEQQDNPPIKDIIKTRKSQPYSPNMYFYSQFRENLVVGQYVDARRHVNGRWNIYVITSIDLPQICLRQPDVDSASFIWLNPVLTEDELAKYKFFVAPLFSYTLVNLFEFFRPLEKIEKNRRDTKAVLKAGQMTTQPEENFYRNFKDTGEATVTFILVMGFDLEHNKHTSKEDSTIEKQKRQKKKQKKPPPKPLQAVQVVDAVEAFRPDNSDNENGNESESESESENENENGNENVVDVDTESENEL